VLIYVVGVVLFSWFVLLIEVNAWEDEWLVGIGTLQEGKKKAKKTTIGFKEMI
jgi:hypothetical protein